MLSSDDHPGLFTFMVGLIVIVFVAVGMSMMVDKKFSFSKRVSSLANGIKAGESEISELSHDHEIVSKRLAEEEPKTLKSADARDTLRKRAAEATGQRASLVANRDALRKSIPAIEAEFAQYREKYRTSTWAAAVGESLGNLSLRGGREYRQAVISRVTDVGLEIRHEHGIARIQAPDLDPSFQDRFQWNDEERRARLAAEKAAHEAIAPSTEPEPLPKINRPRSNPSRTADSKPDSSRDDVDPDQLATLRSNVIAWKSKVIQLDADRSQAVSSASYGGQSSVPGSLETWQAKAARLGSELARARAKLAEAKAALSLISPDDALLRPEPERMQR